MTLSRKLAKLILEKNVPVDDVVQTLHKYKLLALLPSIKEDVMQMSSHLHTYDSIAIEAPFALSDDALKHIKQIVGGPTINHETTINKDLLAGFKARWRGTLYDGSAERIIRQLTK